MSEEMKEVVELAEEIADWSDDLWLAFTFKQRGKVLLSLGMLASGIALVSATTAYLITRKKLTAKYDEQLAAEIEEAKEFYAKHYKAGDFETPAAAVEALGVQSDLVDDAVSALDRYQGNVKVERETVEVEMTPVRTTQNVFTDNELQNDVWDLEAEIANRTEDEPYIISKDEYNEGDRDYEQIALTYYSEDDVLIDEEDKPIENVDNVVGEGNLTRFGHGSNDNRVVYIRNDAMSYDFVIVKKDSSYAKTFLGFQHSDDGHRRPSRRSRGVDD